LLEVCRAPVELDEGAAQSRGAVALLVDDQRAESAAALIEGRQTDALRVELAVEDVGWREDSLVGSVEEDRHDLDAEAIGDGAGEAHAGEALPEGGEWPAEQAWVCRGDDAQGLGSGEGAGALEHGPVRLEAREGIEQGGGELGTQLGIPSSGWALAFGRRARQAHAGQGVGVGQGGASEGRECS
jgi:hypothetical protein